MNNKTIIFLLIVLGIAGAFYWFQIRPSKIRSDCARSYGTIASYERCLHRSGLTK